MEISAAEEAVAAERGVDPLSLSNQQSKQDFEYDITSGMKGKKSASTAKSDEVRQAMGSEPTAGKVRPRGGVESIPTKK